MSALTHSNTRITSASAFAIQVEHAVGDAVRVDVQAPPDSDVQINAETPQSQLALALDLAADPYRHFSNQLPSPPPRPDTVVIPGPLTRIEAFGRSSAYQGNTGNSGQQRRQTYRPKLGREGVDTINAAPTPPGSSLDIAA